MLSCQGETNFTEGIIMKNYKYYEVTTCRLAIQVCIGYGSNGRKKHRTFSMKNINPNASWEAIMKIINALAPVLEYPITDIQKVTSRKIFFYEDAAPAAPAIALAVPASAPLEAEILPADPLDLDSLDMSSLDTEIAIWEVRKAKEEQEKFVLALLMYMLWAWNLSSLRVGFGRAPPARPFGAAFV